MKKYFKEAVLWVLMGIPFIYLVSIWNHLPERVPIHFGIGGDPNGWSSKIGLMFITGGLVVGTYLIMLIIPKRKITVEQMGYNYYNMRFIITLFISVLMTFCLHLSNAGHM